ncbi:hypothetical protein N9O51_05970 [Saprospiraceae bacterium]|nr:hypothetical protein [Saprospiraceae bacterium]
MIENKKMNIKFSLVILFTLISVTFTNEVTAQNNEAYSQSKIFFNVDMPPDFWISCVYGCEENTVDYADYKISYQDTLNYITTSSYDLGRTACSSVKECFEEQLLAWSETINITYQLHTTFFIKDRFKAFYTYCFTNIN